MAASVSLDTLDRLIGLRDVETAALTAARIAREQAMQDVTLDGVGEAVWRTLWEAARAYSDIVAYPDHNFPVVEDAVCVLCQQPFTTEGSERFTRFETFIRDTTQESARGYSRVRRCS